MSDGMRSLALAVAVAGLAVSAAWGQGVVLVEEGRPRAALVVPSRAGAAERAAAQLLQDFVRRMSGAELRVLIVADLGQIHVQPGRVAATQGPAAGMNLVLVGVEGLARLAGVEAEDLGVGGLHVQTFANGVALLGGPASVEGEAGRDDGGLRHAAIELLEQLGCRYLWPGRTGLVVPEKPTLVVPEMRVSFTPQIRARNIRTSFGGARAMDGFNRFGDLTEEQLAAARQKAAEGAPGISWNAWQRLGGRMPNFGHAGAGLRNGAQYLETHPEWFAMQADGTRDQAGDPRWRLCKSNMELIEHVANDIIQQRNENPNMELASLCGNDGGSRTYFCVCEDCLALDPPEAPKVQLAVYPNRDRRTRERRETPSLTDRHVFYWNAIAERVTEVHPDLLFGVSAYAVHSTAPVQRKLHPNLVVRYVPSGVDEVPGWQAAGCQRLFWRPNILLANRRHGKWVSIVGRLCEAMNYFADAGIVQTDFDSNLGFWATMGPSFYAAARLNWNPRLTPDEILADYTQGGFGAGAEHVAEFIRRVETAAPGVDDIAGLRELLNRAEQAAADEAVSERIAFLRLGLNFTDLSERLADKNRRATEGEAVDRDLARRLVDLHCLVARDIVLNHYDAINISYVIWGSGTFGGYARIGGRTLAPSDAALLERVSDPRYGWTGREDSLEEMFAAFGM